jgi:phosphohistidine phosphatase
VKKLFLVRHAKSSWSNPDLDDIERPLNKRGKRDAPFMGKVLNDNHINPDLIISSPAERAFLTAKTIAEQIDYPIEKIQIIDRLYHGGFKDLLVTLKGTKSSINTLMLFGHNPGLTDLSNYISNQHIENIPTTGIVEIDLRVNNWNEIDEDSGTFVDFEFPKKFFKK